MKQVIQKSQGQWSKISNVYFFISKKERERGTGKLDKGISNEVVFIRSANSGRHPLITFNELVNTTLTTFKILTSLSVYEPVIL